MPAPLLRIRTYAKPIDGTGENPTLSHGYANCEYCVCCWKAIWLSVFWEFPSCRIVGIDAIDVPSVMDVGNAMLAVWKLVLFWNSDWKLVSELFCTMVGKPQDMGIRDAIAGKASKAITPMVSAVNISLLCIILPSSGRRVWSTFTNILGILYTLIGLFYWFYTSP